MKSILLAFFLSTSVLFTAFGQMVQGSNGNDTPGFILPNADGSSLLLYNSAFGFDSGSVAVARLDANLAPQQTKSYKVGVRGMHYWTAATAWPGGGHLVAGKYINSGGFGDIDAMFLMRLKPNGDTLRSMLYHRNLDDQIVSLSVNGRKEITGLIYLGGGIGQLRILNMDSLGNVLDFNRYEFQNLDMFGYSMATNEYGMTAISGANRSIANLPQPFLLYIRGAEVKGYTLFDAGQLQSGLTSVKALPGGDFLMTAGLATNTTGGVLSVRTDSVGVVRWNRYHEAPNVLFINNDLYVFPNGEYIVPGSLNFSTAAGLHYTADGTLLSSEVYSPPVGTLGPLALGTLPSGPVALSSWSTDIALFRTNAAFDGICQKQSLGMSLTNLALTITRGQATRSAPANLSRPNLHFLQANRIYGTASIACPALAVRPSRSALPLSMSPNPAANWFYLEGLQEKAEVRLLDSQGRIVLTKTITPGEAVEVGRIPGGVYRVEATQRNEVRAGVVVLE